MSSEREDFDYTKVKVKQERLSPSPPKQQDDVEALNDIIPKIFSASPKENNNNKRNEEEKKTIEPIKSSNEILAELFRVFNAAPPESLMNDDFLRKKKKKHKSKDKKHKKKSKKRGRSSSDEDDSEERKSHKKHKKKKHKKTKKRDDSSDGEEHIVKHENSNNEQKDKTSDISDFVISDEDEYMPSVPSPLTSVDIKQEKKDDSPKYAPGKIIIKSLKNSAVFKEAELSKQKQEKKVHRDDSSELSLSDEETYLKEKELRYYKDKDFYERRSRYHGRGDNRRYRDSSRDRFRSSWRDSRSRSRSRRRNRSRSRRPEEFTIDKKRLLEIARKNAISMFKNGSLPGTQSMTQEVKDKVLMKMRYGGKTVEELTEFCKKLTKGESLNDLSSLSSNDDSDHDKDGNERAFHHPFVLKDRGPIVMNIKNATPIPPKTAEQTKAILMQYPVSSGQQHRLNENEWIPVSPKRPEPPTVLSQAPLKVQSTKNVFEKPLPSAGKQLPAFVPTTPLATPSATETIIPTPVAVPASIPPPVIPDVITVPSTVQQQPPTAAPKLLQSVFPQCNSNVDVSSIITKRLNAMRKLQENPADPEALKMMYNSQKDMSAWATSKFTPGQFTGSTGANVLSAKELTAGQQAWAKRIPRRIRRLLQIV